MKKTSLVVLNLPIACLVQAGIAKAQNDAPTSLDAPTARASPDERRLRLGVEQAVATNEHYSDPDGNENMTSGWGFGATEIAADYRVIAGLEAGLAIGVNGTRSSSESLGGGEFDSSSTWFSLYPRVGYAFPLGERFSLVPRAGVRYLHGIMSGSFIQPDGRVTEQTATANHLALVSGVILEYRPAPWFFVGPAADFGYQVHTHYERVGSTWFSDQPSQIWRLDWKIAAGARI
jgi:hypothetical protein